jgi:hypothetical protein
VAPVLKAPPFACHLSSCQICIAPSSTIELIIKNNNNLIINAALLLFIRDNLLVFDYINSFVEINFLIVGFSYDIDYLEHSFILKYQKAVVGGIDLPV